MLVDKDPAYLLHLRPYRDSSVVAHFLTHDNGKLSAIVSGMKSTKSEKKALLQVCQGLSISYSLKTNLSKISAIERLGKATKTPSISYFMLYQYAHELLLKILPEQLPVMTIFQTYEQFLSLLVDDKPHLALRRLEIALIEQFSSLPDFTVTQDTQQSINSEQSYYFDSEQGITEIQVSSHGRRVSGDYLRAFHYIYHHSDDHASEALAQGAQPVTRYLINHLLGNQVLKTRSIYKELQNYL